MPRLSANLGFLWPDRPLLQRIAAAAAAGFHAVEMHWPYDVPADQIAATSEQHGVIVLGVNTRPGDAARGDFGLGAVPGREREFQTAVDQSIAYCRATGAKFVHAMAGVVTPDDKEAARAVLRANLTEAADKAGACGVTLLLEAINPRDKPGYFYSTIAEAAAMIDIVARPNIKLMFDVYHVAVSEGDVITKLRRYLPMIGHVQIASVPDRAEPDEGEIAYRVILAELDRLRYSGWIGCEYKPRGDTDAGLVWMKCLMARR